jgi:hypothetical protein
MTTIEEVGKWIRGAGQRFGDASVPVCQLFFRWTHPLQRYSGEMLACGMIDGKLHLHFDKRQTLMLPIISGAPLMDPFVAYGAERITKGVWSISPSLNLPSLLHGFVVLYEVPVVAPWE